MVLDLEDRGALESLVESAIKSVPALLAKIRNAEVRSRLQITNSEEFCYGNVRGFIAGQFTTYYSSKYNRPIPDETMEEMGNILDKHSKAIKDAIFNCG